MMGEGNFWGDVDMDGDADQWDDLLGDAILVEIMRIQRKYERGQPLTEEEAAIIGVDWKPGSALDDDDEASDDGDNSFDDEGDDDWGPDDDIEDWEDDDERD